MCRLRPNDEGPDHHVARLSPLRRLAAPVRLLGLRRRARHGEEPKSQETLEQSSGAALERSGRNSFSSFSELSQRRWGPRPIDSIHSEASARPRHVACRRDSTRPVSGSKRFSFKAPTDTASQPEAAEHVNLQRAERRSNPSPSDRLQTANRADTRRRPQTPSPSPRSALGPPAPEPSLPLRPRGGAQASEPRLPPGQGQRGAQESVAR